jgi:hypothetical protein
MSRMGRLGDLNECMWHISSAAKIEARIFHVVHDMSMQGSSEPGWCRIGYGLAD